MFLENAHGAEHELPGTLKAVGANGGEVQEEAEQFPWG